MDSSIDPTTGLPIDIVPYAPDVAVYDAMVRHHQPAWLDELPLAPGPPHHRVGTHATSTWLLADDARTMELAVRGRLLDERRPVVHACTPPAEAAAHATLDLVTAWLDDRSIRYRPPDPAEPPLVAAGRLVQEDLCLMIHRDGAWHLDAGVVCFPTLWQLHDRLGLPTARVHERVPHYDEIGSRVDRFFDRLTPDRIVWRRNLSIKPYPHLHLPVVGHEPSRAGHAVGPDGEPYWIRTERQTLRRIEGLGAIVFGIKIQTARAGVLRARPDIAAAMAAHLRSWDAPLRDYKFGDDESFVAFVGWLDQIATAQ